MNKKFFVIQFLLGIIVALTGAYIIFHGSIFKENNSGIATVIVIIGIGLIASSHVWSIKK